MVPDSAGLVGAPAPAGVVAPPPREGRKPENPSPRIIRRIGERSY